MKKIKKNIFGIGLALAMIMGVGFGLVPQSVSAEGVGSGGNQILCYSASIECEKCDYIDCLTCKRRDKRRFQGESGLCTPTPD